MKLKILLISIIGVLFLNLNLFAGQEPQPLIRYQDKKTRLFGYKDAKQDIKIPPKFIMADAYEFKNIIGVIEQKGKNDFTSYYLLRSGEKVGIDSLYMIDNTPDCECEGKIRFRDRKTHKVGFFDSNGRVAIPAIYSDATPFRNNMAQVLKDAKRVCPNGKIYSYDQRNCEHPRWNGGKTYLIDEHNKILIKDFKFKNHLDWFSLKIMDNKSKNPLRESFLGTNGKYFTFVNFKKEFKNWLEFVFLLSDDIESLKKHLFEKIVFWDDDARSWKKVEKEKFLRNNFAVLYKLIQDLNKKELKYEVFGNPLGFNRFLFDEKIYSPYFDSCGNPKNWKYPAFDLVITHHTTDKTNFLYQDHFKFLKTKHGYRLISLSLRSAKIKNPAP